MINEVSRACGAIMLLEPAWVEFSALLNEHRGGEPPEFAPGHPWGCHRRRVPDRVVFEHVVAALVHGSGYERIATPGCSDRTIRRRVAQWAGQGAHALHAAALQAYDQVIGLQDFTQSACAATPGNDLPQGGISVSGVVVGAGLRLLVARVYGRSMAGTCGVPRRSGAVMSRAGRSLPGWLGM